MLQNKCTLKFKIQLIPSITNSKEEYLRNSEYFVLNSFLLRHALPIENNCKQSILGFVFLCN